MAGDFDLSPDDYAEDHPSDHRPFRHPPGSHHARGAGCTCPIISNAYGRGTDAGVSERLFVIDPGCQYHLPAAPPAESRE
jgi:hypothetical protein